MAVIYISIGSNIDKEVNVPSSIRSLESHFGELKSSSIYLCDAVGFDGPEFYNLVISAKTNYSVAKVVDTCKQIELAHGRPINAKKFTPRTLDLDLLLYDNLVMQQPAVLPREEIVTRAFVLWPLAELAGEVKHPVLNQRFSDLWQAFDKENQQIRKLPSLG